MIGLIFSLAVALEGPKSKYTDILIEQLPKTPWEIINPVKADPHVNMECYLDPDDDFYIGAGHQMKIQAPLKKVGEIVSDIDHYQQLFPGFEEVKIKERKENVLTVFWEQIIPVFFLPNVTYETYYLSEASDSKIVYRYQLKKSSNLKASDGIIVLESKGPQNTFYTEYDFFKADYGILKALAPERIWKDALKSMYASDVAVKVKAENPNFDYPTIRKTTEEATEHFDWKEVLNTRKKFCPKKNCL
jgi:hypothetical protein